MNLSRTAYAGGCVKQLDKCYGTMPTDNNTMPLTKSVTALPEPLDCANI